MASRLFKTVVSDELGSTVRLLALYLLSCVSSSHYLPRFLLDTLKMTTTARSGSPTDEELLHIDDRRVYGYDPLAQPALIKYGVYWRPVIITLTAHRTFPCRYSALKRVSLGHFPCTPRRRFNHPETRRPRTSHRRSLLDSLSRTGP